MSQNTKKVTGSTKAVKVPSIDELVQKSPPKKSRDLVKNRIAEILEKKKMSQAELAYNAEMYPAHLSEIIRSSRKGVGVAVAIKIAKSLNMSVEEIFYIE